MDYGTMELLDYSEKFLWWFHHYESNEVTKTSLFALTMDMEMLESGEQMVHYQGEVVVEQKNDEMVGCYEDSTMQNNAYVMMFV